jgi:tetratricopeptide (TPR) repeat protein
MGGPSLRQIAVALLLLGVLGLATHGRVVENDYAFDAFYIVRDNPQVRPDVSIVEVFSSPYWSGEAASGRGLYRPLSVLSFQLTHRVWEEPVAVDHALDLGLHVLCCLALLAFLMQMGARFGVALTLSVVFLLHPVQTEVVASLVGRTDLLATLFALLALNFALARRVSGPWLWIGIWALFSMSLLAKESTANLMLLLPACWAARELWRGTLPAEAIRGALPMVCCLGLAVACNLALRQAVLGDLLVAEAAVYDDESRGFFELRWRALAFTSLYAQKLIWPHPLLPDYLTGVVPIAGFGLNLRALLGGAMILGSAAWPAWAWFRDRSLTRVHLGILLFWIAIAPVSNLIVQIGTPFGERLLYFPLIFLLLSAIDLPLWRPVRVAGLGMGPKFWPAFAVVAIAMGMLSAARIPEWKNNLSLFRAAIRDCPENYYSQMSFGATLMREGGGPYERDLTLKAFTAAARIRPDSFSPPSMLGQLAYAEGDYPTARSYLEQANDRARGRERKPAALNLSRTYQAMEQFALVESLLVPLAQAHPEWIELQRELGDYWMSRGRIADALAQFERVLLAQPRDRTLWRAIIRAHLHLEQNEQAIQRLEAAPPGTVDYKFKLQLERDGLALPI